MPVFDSLQDNLFTQVKTTMGYSASWQPSAGGGLQIAIVLYNGPTEKEKIFSVDYDPDKLKMEYQDTDFIQLKDAVDTDPDAEKVFITISGTEVPFKIKSIKRLWDGKTFEAQLKAITI